MILRGDRHVIVSVSVNRGYWTGGHYPEAWTPVSVFKESVGFAAPAGRPTDSDANGGDGPKAEPQATVSGRKRYDPEPKGAGVEPHYHDGDEFWLFAEGQGEVWVDGRVYPITPNTAVYTPRGVVHRFQVFTEFQNNALVTRLEGRQRQGHLVPAVEGEPLAAAAPIIVGGEQNDGPFPERGPRCPLSELRAVTVAAGEPAAGLDGTAAANEHLLVLAGDVELTVDGVTVTLARGDAAFLRGGASRRVASPEGARVALARE